MAISDRITSIEEHIKESYQELEGIGIDTTGVNKNLENIPKLIDGYWETLPKVTREGTSITLDNTKEGKMKINLKGNTSQNSTTGKNLLNIVGTYTEHRVTSTGTNDGKLVCSGTCDATYFTISNGNIAQTLPAGTYTFSIDKALSFGIVLRCIYASSTPQTNKRITAGNTSVTFTIDEPVEYLRVYAEGNISSGTNINATFYPMLESGSSATSFEPYTNGTSPNPDYPQDIHVVSGDNEIVVVGKNIGRPVFDSGFYISGSGDNRKVASRPTDKCGEVIQVKPNTNYTISGTFTDFADSVVRIALFDNVPIVDSKGTAYYNTNSSTTFTTGANTNYILLYDLRARSVTVDDLFVCETQYASTYEPYQSTTYPINLPEGMFMGWIENYQDYFYKQDKKWYLEKKIGKVVLNGSESWSDFSVGDTNFRCQYDVALPNILTPPTNPAQLFSNYFKAINRDNAYAKTEIGIAQYGSALGKVFICAPNTILSEQTLASWKTWLSTHNTIVYYVLNTPTTTEITDSTLLSQLNALAKSYTSQTNISQENNDLASLLNATALSE